MHDNFPLTHQDKANLATVLPPKLLQHSDSLSLLACYGNSSFPATALHYLERQHWQREGAEEALAQIETLLLHHQLWRALRDVYIRAANYPLLSPDIRQRTCYNAFLLALYRATDPAHATQLFLDLLAAPESETYLTDDCLRQTMKRCITLGWHQPLKEWLLALQQKGRVLPQQQALLQELNARYPAPSHTPPHDTDAIRTQASDLQMRAVKTPSPEDARHLWLLAAQRLSSSIPTHTEAIDCWIRLLQQAPQDSVRWHALYETTIPTQLWELLGHVLRRFPTRQIQLPTAPRLRLPLLMALEQRNIPQLEPTPLLLVAFQQNPLQHRRFQALFQLLQETQQWRLLKRVMSLRLAYLCVPSLRPTAEAGAEPDADDGPSRSKLPNQAHADLAALLDALQRHSPDAHSEIFSAFALTIAFAPHEDALLSQLAQWSHSQPAPHPTHNLLRHFALEGLGDLNLQLEIAAKLTHANHIHNDPETQQALQIYQQILHTKPNQFDAIQHARTIAIQQQRYEDALALFQQELKYQQDNERRIDLLLQMASLLSAQLHRYKDATNACQDALRLNPRHPQVLKQMAALLEHQQLYERLLPILGQLLPQLETPEERRATLRKLTRFALNPAKDHTTVLRALRDLLQQPQTTPECIDALEQLLQLPKAQAPLLSFLLEQEQLSDPNAQPHIKLLIVRLMFRLLRFQEGRSRLKQFLKQAKDSLPLLQRCEEVAIEHRTWNELADTIQYQIELLLVAPHATPSLGSLYLRLASLSHHLLDDPQRAQEAHRRALFYAPQHPEAQEPILQQWLALGAHTEACTLLFNHVRRLPPNQAAAALTRLAHLQHQHLQQTNAAIASLTKALELNPQHTPALQALYQLQHSQHTNTSA